MAMLYSSFPVMVIREVVPGCRTYFESGWCYSEYVAAFLGRQLRRYSSDFLELPEAKQLRDVMRHNEQGDIILKLMTSIDSDLQQKHFRSQDDRETVRRMTYVFLLKKLMLDAIFQDNAYVLYQICNALEDEDMLRIAINQPVNCNVDTLLHYAVRWGRTGSVRVLLEKGAYKWLRNRHGDLPTQKRSIFRFWSRAAWACRNITGLQESVIDAESVSDGFANQAARPRSHTLNKDLRVHGLNARDSVWQLDA